MNRVDGYSGRLSSVKGEPLEIPKELYLKSTDVLLLEER